MSDAVFFTMIGLLAAGAITLALVWPQGLGAVSPPPFGHPLSPELAAPAPPHRSTSPPGAIPAPGAALDGQLKGAL